jgi:hypothetical protein
LKSDLRDVLYSHKWTPDAYLLAKAYIAEDDAKSAKEKSLPKVALKNPSRKLYVIYSLHCFILSQTQLHKLLVTLY